MKGIIRKGSKAENRLREVYIDLHKKIDTGEIGELALTDVSTICCVAKNLVACGVTSTLISEVAEYFKSFGFMVTMDFNNVNYVIVA